MKAIRVEKHGDSSVLNYQDISTPSPEPGQVKIKNRAIGLNFTDIYFRKGIYDPGQLPFTPGNEAAGEIIAVGDGVEGLAVGDRVAYVNILGAYAEESVVPARYVVKLPDSISFETGAAIMLKGLTAHYLLHSTYQLKAGQTILVHAAAGGVGSLLTQWAKHLGATVIGTVGSAEKMAIAKQNGCDAVINYNEEDFVQRVEELTGGEKCHVVYDSIGKATFVGSLDCLRPRGYFVSYGTASGPVDTLDMALLAQKGSLFATSPVLFDYIEQREDIVKMSQKLFEVIESGVVTVAITHRLPLADAAKAHDLLESRQTTGATVLLP